MTRRERILDERVVDIFPNWHQATAFRKAVTSPIARKIISVESQYALAKAIVESARKGFGKKQVGAAYIKSKVQEKIAQGLKRGRVTDDEAEAKRYQRNIRNAQATCCCCGKCGSKLTADAPVWRERVFLGQGRPGRPGVKPGMRYAVAPVCERCKPRLGFGFLPEQPCVTCGRPVHDEDTRLARQRTVCCERCASAARATAARHRRSDKRGTGTCATCGEAFEPTRSDAKFCSSRCRQRAYRRAHRVTDDEVDTQCGHVVSRNADRDDDIGTRRPQPISRNGVRAE